ncbi:uncharacterized protein LY89DRAFT_677771 [Mollisia scopiformis]|uniref:Uncharacterized protein n=1 Tax=Mollisia scopiformis TaxID=149040 RepID=A0A132B6P4_MOLSC|nr:uncharacterized protein LY89DRAFT_677771 [Mollisia scopiformis]KUJ07554.1 hypothetical protein LY89DRAFT_677771 [Mollisia scopiformis]
MFLMNGAFYEWDRPEHLICKFTNGDGKGHFRRLQQPNPAFQGNTRTVSAVLFGLFRVEEITMPAVFDKDLQDVLLIANPHPALRNTEGQYLMSTSFWLCLSRNREFLHGSLTMNIQIRHRYLACGMLLYAAISI